MSHKIRKFETKQGIIFLVVPSKSKQK